MEMKCCPKCGSTEIDPSVFYRPSIWICSNCGYEGAFIIEHRGFAEQKQGSFGRRVTIDLTRGERCVDYYGSSADGWSKT